MKIATWNVNSIRTRQQHVINWLSKNEIDVLCLQETKVIDSQFPKDPFEKLGYHLYIFGQKAYNGVAILTRQPMLTIQTGFNAVLNHAIAEEFDQQKRVITGRINSVQIVNIYVPNGAEIGSEKYDYKLRWLKVLKSYLQQLSIQSSSQLCVCGDFNIALEDRDIYDAQNKDNHIMSSPPEREALKDVLSIGLQDAFRKFNAEEGHFSWWDYRSGGFQRNRGWRIDHHYLTPQLYEQAIRCTIDIEPRKLQQPSDHAPVIVELDVNCA